MVKFESDIKSIETTEEKAFYVLSDLRNIQAHLDKLPDDQVKVERVEEDSVFFKVEHAGEVGLKIIDKEPHKTIKFEAVNSPVNLNLWIQLKEVKPGDTKVKLTIKSDMSSMVKMMIGKPLKKFLDKLADGIAAYDFS